MSKLYPNIIETFDAWNSKQPKKSKAVLCGDVVSSHCSKMWLSSCVHTEQFSKQKKKIDTEEDHNPLYFLSPHKRIREHCIFIDSDSGSKAFHKATYDEEKNDDDDDDNRTLHRAATKYKWWQAMK